LRRGAAWGSGSGFLGRLVRRWSFVRRRLAGRLFPGRFVASRSISSRFVRRGFLSGWFLGGRLIGGWFFRCRLFGRGLFGRGFFGRQFEDLVASLADVLFVRLLDLLIRNLLFGFFQERREGHLEVGKGQLVRLVERRFVEGWVRVAIAPLLEECLDFRLGRLFAYLTDQRLHVDGVGLDRHTAIEPVEQLPGLCRRNDRPDTRGCQAGHGQHAHPLCPQLVGEVVEKLIDGHVLVADQFLGDLLPVSFVQLRKTELPQELFDRSMIDDDPAPAGFFRQHHGLHQRLVAVVGGNAHIERLIQPDRLPVQRRLPAPLDRRHHDLLQKLIRKLMVKPHPPQLVASHLPFGPGHDDWVVDCRAAAAGKQVQQVRTDHKGDHADDAHEDEHRLGIFSQKIHRPAGHKSLPLEDAKRPATSDSADRPGAQARPSLRAIPRDRVCRLYGHAT